MTDKERVRAPHIKKRAPKSEKNPWYLPKEDYVATFNRLIRKRDEYHDLQDFLNSAKNESNPDFQFFSVSSIIGITKRVCKSDDLFYALLENIFDETPYEDLKHNPGCTRAKFYRTRQKLIYKLYLEEKRKG